MTDDSGDRPADYAFPADLLDPVKAGWDAAPALPGFRLPDDDTLRRLLETCYHASLRTSELRRVRFVVAYVGKELVPDRAELLFERPVPLTGDELVRLAPVTEVRQTLIGCDDAGDGGGRGPLRIWGLFEYGHAWARRSAGDPPEARMEEADLPPDCLTVAVEEPGAMSISRGRRPLARLREGRVVPPQRNPLRDMSDPLGRFFDALAAGLLAGDGTTDRPGGVPDDGGKSLPQVVTAAVAAVLDRIRLARHGGSVVIAPAWVGESAGGAVAHVTYPVAGHDGLGGQAVAYWEALRPGTSEDAQGLEPHEEEAAVRAASRRLVRGMNQIALLAAADGAVLLDGALRVRGFGVRFPVWLPPGATVVDAATGVEHPCDTWGLRHQSVFSLCLRCQEAVGLVVSQDGRAKAVMSVGGRLRLWDGILD